MTNFLSSKWPRAFFLVTAVQALICLAFEAYTFAKFQLSLNGARQQDNKDTTSQLRTIPTFLTLFIFAFLYEMVVVWDALRMKNTIQVIGVCIASLAILVYTAIQIEQIQNALDILQRNGAMLNDQDVWVDVRGYLIAIPVIIALTTIILSILAWKLYREFAWDILKAIGADYRMKQRFFYYQIYIALLKFDFFFFLGFTVQFLVVVTGKTDVELYLTIAAIPVTILILLGAAYSARNEIRGGMIATMVLYFGSLSWFTFKLVRIYQPQTRKEYQAVQKSLTAFAVVTILLIILTIANAAIVMSNFGKGLKNHIKASKGRDEEKPDLNSINLNDVKPQLPSRMTID